MARILACYYTHKPGGFCKRLYRLLNALSARGHQVVYYTLDDPPGGALSPQVEVRKLSLSGTIRSGAWFWLRFLLAVIFQIARDASFRPDRIVAFGPFYSMALSPLAIARRIPLILFVRLRPGLSASGNFFFRWVVQASDWLGFIAADRIVVQGLSIQRAVERILGGVRRTISILPNETCLTAPEPRCKLIRTGTVVAVTVGVFVKAKNLDLLVNAAKLLKTQSKEKLVEFWIVGEGPELPRIKSEAEVHGLSCLRFLGWKDQPMDVFPEVDLMIHPAIQEGNPNAVLEAMGAGLPVLVSDAKELVEMVADSELVVSAIDPRSLCERIERICCEDEFYRKISTKTFERAKELSFDWDERACAVVLL